MRTVLLASLSRRQGISFPLKTAAYQVIGTMTLNPATNRHEMELSEEDFLKHSKELARLCAIQGLGWYVVEFREKVSDELRGCLDEAKQKLADELKSFREGQVATRYRDFIAARQDEVLPPPDADQAKAPLSDDLEGKPFFTLRKIATDLGIDVTNIKGNDAMKAAIREARLQPA